MNINLANLAKGLKYDLETDTVLIVGGTYNNTPIKKWAWSKKLENHGISEEDEPIVKEQIIQYLKDIAISNTNNKSLDLKQLCIDNKIFDPFTIVNILDSNTSNIYMNYKGNFIPVGKKSAFNVDEFREICLEYSCDSYDRLVELLDSLLPRPKDHHFNKKTALEKVFNNFEVTKIIKTITIPTEFHPATVEGCEVLSNAKIPYVKTDVTIDNLNPYLKNLLLQIENHEYFCSVLWGTLNGQRYRYVMYLKGNGNDGKTSFITMLGNLFGSIANYRYDNQFSLSNLYGKAIIWIGDTNNTKLLQDNHLKSVTGNGLLTIERKGQQGFDAKIRGLVIADSNHDLEIFGDDFETSRLRYFRVSPPIINGPRLLPDPYIKEISSTPNEFLNYCRQCFEGLGAVLGQELPEPKNFDKTIIELLDPELNYKFDKFVKDCLKGYKFDPELKCDRGEVVYKLRKEFKNDKFIKINFDRWLRGLHNVKSVGLHYIGFGKEEKIQENRKGLFS